MSETKPVLNLYQKISRVMKDVEYLSKDDKVEFNNTKYKAISEEKVTSTVRESLIRNGLIILPIEQSHKREGTLSTVDTKYKIIDIDTGEFEIIVSSGTGADTQDKGVGKAMTYSYKYLLLRSFAIPTGEDPDKISSAELDEKQRKEAEQKAKEAEADAAIYPQLKAKWETLAGSLEGFEEWHGKQKIAGLTNDKMNKFLASKIAEKKKESA
jgi:hypothetical protein